MQEIIFGELRETKTFDHMNFREWENKKKVKHFFLSVFVKMTLRWCYFTWCHVRDIRLVVSLNNFILTLIQSTMSTETHVYNNKNSNCPFIFQQCRYWYRLYILKINIPYTYRYSSSYSLITTKSELKTSSRHKISPKLRIGIFYEHNLSRIMSFSISKSTSPCENVQNLWNSRSSLLAKVFTVKVIAFYVSEKLFVKIISYVWYMRM